ncbi:MAG TPA: sugar ABC transporter permease [Clostridia bacterium]|jgi:arabinogalactan oligomer/maltooligosaccharide transport system permease protein|nr:sugar ABC transporter permease [Clostridia bacterium]HQM39992.1 sugar ABC transporter permease [Clostridia bacterium]
MDKNNNGIARFLKKISKPFIRFYNRFMDGSLGTKMSHFVMGSGNVYHGQIIKGLIYFTIQAGYALFMITCPKVNNTPLGYKAFINLITLGTEEGDIFTPADNSMLMLLFGVVTIGITLMYLFAYNSNIKSSYKADQDIKNYGKVTSFKQDAKEMLGNRFYITMLTPAALGAVVFTLLPTIFMILIAFTNYDKEHQAGLKLFDWVGFNNFTAFFTNPTGEIAARFLPVLAWTLIWAFFATFLNYYGGILLALLINRKGLKGKKIFRAIFVLTIAIPQFVSLLAMRNLIGEYGPMQKILMDIGILSEPMSFLANATNVWTARIAIILINLWVGIPYSMLLASGAIMNIPESLYEAARIDGAKKFTILRKITMPYIVFITTPYLISSFVGNITSFNIIYLLTNGNPKVTGGYIAGGTDLLVTWLYKLTIDEQQYNLGAVIGILTFLITSIVTLVTYRRSKSYKEEDAFQ